MFRRRARHHHRLAQPLHYYVYVSDSKIDMLFAQIPDEPRARLLTELKISIKVVSMSIKDSPTEDTRYSKLNVICQYLDRQESIGTVDEPKEYFAGTLNMRWGPYGGIYGEEREMVYFGGLTAHTIVGMGGSMKHVIGAGGDGAADAHSATPALYAALTREVDLSSGVMSRVADPLLGAYDSAAEAESDWSKAVKLATTQQRGEAETLEFVARKVNYAAADRWGPAILLGTPIYVRYTDTSRSYGVGADTGKSH